MKKFEQIITECGNIGENATTYIKLYECLHLENANIVCYVGAGLSLYCKSWESLLKYVYEYIPKYEKEKKGLAVEWDEYKKERKDSEYMKIAEEIDQILKNADRKSSFNRIVNQYVTRQIAGKKQVSSNAAKGYVHDKEGKEMRILMESVYYLPFFLPGVPIYENQGHHKGIVLTTNLDDSIKSVFEYYNLRPTYLSPKDGTEVIERNEDNYIVFYIHGYYEYMGSYIMTETDYRRFYEEGGGEKLLNRYASDRDAVWIFLGAGMSDDRPLKTVRETFAKMERKQSTNFVFLEDKDIVEKHDNVEINYFANLFIIPENEFYCYSIIFCQLIREAKGECWNTFGCKRHMTHSLFTDNDAIKDEEINDFLDDDKCFDKKEYIIDEMLKRKLKNHLFDNYLRSFKWAVCWIDSKRFRFSSDNFDPIKYNWPLGNTIYLIRGISFQETQNHIQLIQKWCDDNRKIFEGGIKVRVIYQPQKDYLIERLRECCEKCKENELVHNEVKEMLNNIWTATELSDKTIYECEVVLQMLSEHVYNGVLQIYDYLLEKLKELNVQIRKENQKKYQVAQKGEQKENEQKEEYSQSQNAQEYIDAKTGKALKKEKVIKRGEGVDNGSFI